jgi:hypothetical protein
MPNSPKKTPKKKSSPRKIKENDIEKVIQKYYIPVVNRIQEKEKKVRKLKSDYEYYDMGQPNLTPAQEKKIDDLANCYKRYASSIIVTYAQYRKYISDPNFTTTKKEMLSELKKVGKVYNRICADDYHKAYTLMQKMKKRLE